MDPSWNKAGPQSECCAILSVSSGGYLDGRNPEHCGGPNLFLTYRNPVGDRYLQWKIVPLANGHYAILSLSSGGYLDGRNPEHCDGPNIFLTRRAPENDRYLQWDIIDMHNGHFAILSLSSGGYIDGRNPEHCGGPNVFITRRNPQGDNYLQWNIVKFDVPYNPPPPIPVRYPIAEQQIYNPAPTYPIGLTKNDSQAGYDQAPDDGQGGSYAQGN